jgi:uncharacterized membrane protein YraQ (UPF0718 family)
MNANGALVITTTAIITVAALVWKGGHTTKSATVLFALGMINIANIVVLQWWLNWYLAAALVGVAVFTACGVLILRAKKPERSSK